MAQIHVLSWNIEVYGPKKYGEFPANGASLVDLIAQVIHQQQANVVMFMEFMSSVAYQIGFSIQQQLIALHGNVWQMRVVEARPQGDRESYAVLWRTDQNFGIVTDQNVAEQIGLATSEFPNNFSTWNGRRPVYATFRTTDTNQNFTVTCYHAPPNNYAVNGLTELAQMPQLYSVNNTGVAQAVDSRFLCGDFNLDLNIQPEYQELTNPVPAVPPPPPGGAGCAAAINEDTLLANLDMVVTAWGNNTAHWGAAAANYRRNGFVIDNIFFRQPGGGHNATAAGAVDVIHNIMTPGNAVRAAAVQFQLVDNNGNWAFPHADLINPAGAAGLLQAPNAFLLYRYAVSDHLPVFVSVTV